MVQNPIHFSVLMEISVPLKRVNVKCLKSTVPGAACWGSVSLKVDWSSYQAKPCAAGEGSWFGHPAPSDHTEYMVCDAGGPHARHVSGRREAMSASKVRVLLLQSVVQGRRARAERAPGLVTQFAKMRLEDAKEPQAGTFLPFWDHFLAQEFLQERAWATVFPSREERFLLFQPHKHPSGFIAAFLASQLS